MAFRLFDVDGKGFISIKDLKQITDELKEEIKQDELEVKRIRNNFCILLMIFNVLGNDRCGWC